jgi:LTXXQ motif family protein
LHDRLHITPAQEPFWTDLAQVMQENAKSMASLFKERSEVAKSGNAIDTLSADEKLSETQLDGFKKFTAAFRALYNSLTDGQRKIADAMFRLPQLLEQLGTPSPYAYYPSYPTLLSYSAFPYNPPYYSYYPYYNFLFLGPAIGLQRSFFLSRRYPGFFPFRPPVHGGFPPGRAAVMHGQFGRR